MQKVLREIQDTAPSYGSIPFWSWNDKLEEGELRRQIRKMKELGMNGFFMHARGGLETEYLSDDWFHCVNVCVDEAKKLGMEAWSYDENGWPSGFAGGKLLHDKKNFALGLLCETVESFPVDEDTVAAYIEENGEYKWVTAPVDGCTSYLRVYRQYDSSYVDVLDGEITKEFLRLTHEEYKKHVSAGDFGGAMPGFFTDEPQYFRYGHTYSNTLPDVFRKTYGYEIFTGLPYIFFLDEAHAAKADKFRFDYYKLLHEQFINNWVRLVYEWCEENGVRLTGHAVEESSLGGQMMCIGGVMPFYEYEHIPGMDYLGRGISDDCAPKQLGSACAQLGRKKALSEMFACCGWDVSPTELKRIADVQYANGVNLMCQHLYPYGERGQRKRDYPLHYSEHNPWQPFMKSFDEYFANLGAALSRGEEYAPILVIHPIHSAYMRYKKGDGWHGELEKHFFGLSQLLGQNQVPYHYADENMMKRLAHTEGGKLTVGQCTYDLVIVPFSYSLDRETAALLQKYMAEGGKVWLYKDAPYCIDGAPADLGWLRANVTFADVLAKRDVRISTMTGENAITLRKMSRVLPDGSSLVYITNIDTREYPCVEVAIPGAKQVCEVNLHTLETRPVHGVPCACGGTKVYLRFEDAESHMLLVNGEAMPLLEGKPAIPQAYIPVPERACFTEKPENMLTLDIVSLSKDGKQYDAPISLYAVKDNLLREKYNGPVWLKFHFTAGENFRPSSLRLVVEPMGQTSVTVNGEEVHPTADKWWFDRAFATAEIAPYIRGGENEIVIALNHYQREYVYYVLYGGVSESLRNCLNFDTELECIYLVGDFAVRTDAPFVPDVCSSERCTGPFRLENQKDDVALGDVVQDGYTFYGGHIHVTFPYLYKEGMATELGLDGRYAVCTVWVNGEKAGDLMFRRHIDLRPFLREGENCIELDFVNSMRNLMGPHHRPEPEPYGVGPGTFSFEKEWNGRECARYVDSYAFVRFGIVSK